MTPSAYLRVGVVDDHPVVVLGLTAILNAQPDMHLVAAACTALELIGRGNELDVVLLDLALADHSSPARNVAILAAHASRVIAFTAGPRSYLAQEAARAGAAGIITKNEQPAAIVDDIRTIVRRRSTGSEQPIRCLDQVSGVSRADDVGEFVATANHANLSHRESEVLALYASGSTADHVGTLLFISRDTVIDHIRRIRAKYAAVARPAPTKIDLFHRAVEDGLIPPG